jgi:hypothetical protein
VTTLAEDLSLKGYSTLGVAANLYLRREFGLQRGFQTFQIPRPLALLPSESYWYLLRTGMRRVLNFFADTSQFDRLYTRSEDVNREMFSLANSRRMSAPFFVFLNYMDAHFPYIPPEPFAGMFPGRKRGIMQEDMEDTSSRVVQGEAMPEAERLHRIAHPDVIGGDDNGVDCRRGFSAAVHVFDHGPAGDLDERLAREPGRLVSRGNDGDAACLRE